MLNIFKSNALLIVLFILLFVFYSGCVSDFIISSTGWIIIENGAETTKDCTPLLTICLEGAVYMSFSGDGEIWTDWIDYNTS